MKEIPRYAGPERSDRKHKMTREEVRERFDNETAGCYSQKKPAWLPEFDFVFGLVPDLLEPYLPPMARILDLGAGTGNLSRTILGRLDNVRVTLTDFSDNMLGEVPNVLKDFTGRYEIRRADFFKADLPPGAYDAVVSSFAIHHGRGPDEYFSLYQKILKSLKKTGLFVCCDVVDGETPVLAGLNEDGWAGYLDRAGFGGPEIQKILHNYHIEDSPLSVPQHLNLLNKAGFRHTDVAFKMYNFAVYLGIKEA